MRLFCWNVNSLVPTVRNINLKYGSLAAFFAHLDADIVCMQEVKLPDSKLTKDLVIVEGYQSYWACSQSKTGYSGVTTWVRQGFAASSAEADPLSCEGCDREGRAIITDHGAFVLFNLYVPNAGDRPDRARLPAKLSFLAALRERVDDLLGAGRQVVLVGDFNIAAEPSDVHEAIGWEGLYHPSELQALQDITAPSGSGCVDTWRRLHPDTQGVYTVWDEKTSARAFNVGVRIDYALVSSGLLDKVLSCEVLLDMPPKWSDHAPLLLQLDLPAPYAALAAAAEQEEGEGAAPQQQQQLPPPPECPMWQALLKRFQDPSQRSIAAVFKAAGKQKQPAARQKAAPDRPPRTAAAAAAAATAVVVAPPASKDGSSQAAGAGEESTPSEAGAIQPPLQQQQQGGMLDGVQAACAAAGAKSAQDGAAGGQPDALNSPVAAADAVQEVQQPPAAAGAAATAAAAEQQGASDRQQHDQQQSQQQPQQQQQQGKQQGQRAGGGRGSSRQQSGGKRKAAAKSDEGEGTRGSKQAKLHTFFARAASGSGSGT